MEIVAPLFQRPLLLGAAFIKSMWIWLVEKGRFWPFSAGHGRFLPVAAGCNNLKQAARSSPQWNQKKG